MQKTLGESDAARALAVSEKDHALRESSKSGALASQLRIEATGWQARCEQGEAERARSAAEWDINSRRNQEHAESERFRLMAELAAANAERTTADEQWRRNAAEAASTQSLIATQRDEATARAVRAEEALASALSEQAHLNETVARLHEQLRIEKTALESRVAEIEQRWAETAKRNEELSKQRLRLEHERARSEELLAVANHQKRFVEAQLSDERVVAQGAVQRESGLRQQLEAAEWALQLRQAGDAAAASMAHERAALADRTACLKAQLSSAMLSSPSTYLPPSKSISPPKATPTSPSSHLAAAYHAGAAAAGAVTASAASGYPCATAADAKSSYSPPSDSLSNTTNEAYYLSKATEAYYASLHGHREATSASAAAQAAATYASFKYNSYPSPASTHLTPAVTGGGGASATGVAEPSAHSIASAPPPAVSEGGGHSQLAVAAAKAVAEATSMAAATAANPIMSPPPPAPPPSAALPPRPSSLTPQSPAVPPPTSPLRSMPGLTTRSF